MTIAQAHDRIDLLLDKAGAPYYTDNEKSAFMDHAIIEFATERYNIYNVNQKIADELGLLVTRVKTHLIEQV